MATAELKTSRFILSWHRRSVGGINCFKIRVKLETTVTRCVRVTFIDCGMVCLKFLHSLPILWILMQLHNQLGNCSACKYSVASSEQRPSPFLTQSSRQRHHLASFPPIPETKQRPSSAQRRWRTSFSPRFPRYARLVIYVTDCHRHFCPLSSHL